MSVNTQITSAFVHLTFIALSTISWPHEVWHTRVHFQAVFIPATVIYLISMYTHCFTKFTKDIFFLPQSLQQFLLQSAIYYHSFLCFWDFPLGIEYETHRKVLLLPIILNCKSEIANILVWLWYNMKSLEVSRKELKHEQNHSNHKQKSIYVRFYGIFFEDIKTMPPTADFTVKWYATGRFEFYLWTIRHTRRWRLGNGWRGRCVGIVICIKQITVFKAKSELSYSWN